MLTASAHALELEPYEFVAAPPGTVALLGYMDYRNDDFLKSVGSPKISHDTNLDTELGIARAAYYFDVGHTLALVEVLQPFGSLNDARIGGVRESSSSGLGDTILAAALWPINDAKRQTYLGATVYVTVPTGRYEKLNTINLSGNRVTYDPQIALFQGIGKHWAVELTGDVILYGDNDAAGAFGAERLTARRSFQMQAFVDYKWSNGFTTSVGYEGMRGGDERVGGVDDGLRTHYDEVRFTVSKFLTPKFQLMGELNHQFDVEGGFRQDVGLVIRGLRVF